MGLAYPAGPPEEARRFCPPKDFVPAEWLMCELVERDPHETPLARVRSFALRVGNAHYPHMKLRISRPPKDVAYVFSVDSHDTFLSAMGTPDEKQQLEQLKRYNARLAAEVVEAWDSDGLPTERDYLRRKIHQARQARANDGHGPPDTTKPTR